jgi:adenosylhomocysteine nucleosidase
MKKILILCPLPLELKYLLSCMKDHGYESTDSMIGSLRVYEFPKVGLILSLGGHGKAQFGIQTQFLLGHFKDVHTVICAGCAGALTDQINIFDVVVAEKIIEHDYRLKFVQKPNPEYLGCEKLIKRVQEINPKGYQVLIGIIASGDEDILEESRVKELRAQTNALAVSWEGAGAARACKFNKVSFLEVRGITDLCSQTSTSDFKSKLKQAMTNVCELLLASL